MTTEQQPLDPDAFQECLDALLRTIGPSASTGPQDQKLLELVRQASVGRQQLRTALTELADTLGYLRICTKYQAFDLECSRRENAALRKLLEERSP
jgi:hypothetical protein